MTRREPTDTRPWYREPWPWVVIAIPATAVVMGIVTYYLAVTNPDYLVVEEQEYREISSELRAQSDTGDSTDQSPDRPDGDD